MTRVPISLRVRAVTLLVGVILVTAGTAAAAEWRGPVDWPQWGQNAQHQGAVAVPAQSLERVLARTPYDPFVDQERVDGGGSILVHYQTPLLRGRDAFMEFKTGKYTPANGSNDATRWNS